ncbi:MAG TPA: hypothetical protein VHE36_11775, partial [Sphingomicrobium sp.]|nr:hypothetical protein [Sphingomicrobium sp.]
GAMAWMHLAIRRMERRKVPELRGLPELPEMEGLGSATPLRAAKKRSIEARGAGFGEGLLPAK